MTIHPLRRITTNDLDLASFLQELKRWVEIESPTADAEAVNRMEDHVEALAKSAGLLAKRAPGRLGRGDILTVRHVPAPIGGAS